MALPKQIFAPAFAQRKTRWLSLLLVGVMVYVASFTIGIEGMISAFTLTWDQTMDRRMSVEVPTVEDEGATPQSERVKQIISVIAAMPEVAHVEAVPDDQTRQLLKPWIGQTELLNSLPLPSLVDIERRPGAVLSAADLTDRLKPVINNIQVDDHAAWLADLVRLVRGLMIVGGIVIALMALAVVFAVSLLCRVVIAAEHKTITLLHLMGAYDDDIAQHFQYHATRLAAPAALAGFTLGIGSAGLLALLLRDVTDASFLNWTHWALLGVGSLSIPLAAIVIAAFAARVTVGRLLHTVA